MSEGVRKIITVLIVMVICVVVGALVINVIAPNVLTIVLNGIERAVYSATGLSVDINGDDADGESGKNVIVKQDDSDKFSNNGAKGMDNFKEGWAD